MIRLRRLQEKDAPYMLEWMHSQDIQKCFQKDMLSMTLEDAINFCRTSVIKDIPSDGDSNHFAIVNQEDEYLGTISLKNINIRNGTAEYAIATREKVQGHGVAKSATGLLLKKAFGEYGLHRLYLNVLESNKTAIKFYEKCGFKFEGEFRDHLIIEGKYVNLKWYGILESEFDANFLPTMEKKINDEDKN